MSFEAVAKKEFDKLSDAQQRTIVQLMVLFNQSNEKAEKHVKNRVPFNAFAGGLHYISDDFDDTPEGFEEYM